MEFSHAINRGSSNLHIPVSVFPWEKQKLYRNGVTRMLKDEEEKDKGVWLLNYLLL